MAFELFRKIQRYLGLTPPAPLRSLDELVAYTEKQAAFVSQVSLYTYIKTRAGTQYPKLFENETYLVSMKMARWHIFGAAVADLAIFYGGLMVSRGEASPEEAKKLAERIIVGILSGYEQDDIAPEEFDAMIARGKARSGVAAWIDMAEGANAFQSSADALIRWAPIADELKAQDEEIVRNSIHMRWIGIRREIKEILVPEAILTGL
ncbi:hypothetical protein AB8880_02370 [Alphaproteobacteria bacterium LSUCC0684]